MGKKKILIIVCGAVVAAAIISAASVAISENTKNQSYLEGMEAYQNGDYEAARESFEKIGKYQDAEEILKEIDYQEAILAIEAGDDAAAEEVLLQMEDYKDAESYLYQITYRKVKAAMEAGDYDLAEKYADEITGYEDIAELKEEIRYHQAVALIDQAKFDDAQKLLEEISDETYVRTAQNMITYTQYAVPAMQDLYSRYPDPASAQITAVLEARLRFSETYGSSLQVPVIMIHYQVTNADGAVEDIYAGYSNYVYYGACHTLDKNALDMSNQTEMLGYLKIDPNWNESDTIILSAPALQALAKPQ